MWHSSRYSRFSMMMSRSGEKVVRNLLLFLVLVLHLLGCSVRWDVWSMMYGSRDGGQ
jgi:hypothetical protein